MALNSGMKWQRNYGRFAKLFPAKGSQSFEFPSGGSMFCFDCCSNRSKNENLVLRPSSLKTKIF